jgi:anaerobic ribonucleoside-triphosphate reductase activating protein
MFELSTTKLGPGNRFALWVNGCKKSCDGCIVPRSTYTNNFVSVDDLAKLILSQDNIEGITISGGEPFLQSEAIFHLIENKLYLYLAYFDTLILSL